MLFKYETEKNLLQAIRKLTDSIDEKTFSEDVSTQDLLDTESSKNVGSLVKAIEDIAIQKQNRLGKINDEAIYDSTEPASLFSLMKGLVYLQNSIIDTLNFMPKESDVRDILGQDNKSLTDINNLVDEEYKRDAFGRKRVSDPVNVFSNTFQYGLNDLIWFQETNGTGSITHLPNKSAVELEVGTANGDMRALQSKKYLKYEPGKSQLIMESIVLGEGKENCKKLVGYGDKENGIFFQQENDTYSIILRDKTSGTVSKEVVDQIDWNIDKMDGKGKSGIDFNGTKAQLLVIDLEWLSVGRVRVGFAGDGKIYYVHEFEHANIVDSPYMTTANLPLRYEIQNYSTTLSNTTMQVICCSVISEGGQEKESSYPFCAFNGITQIAASARRPILTIRPKGTFAGITNRIEILLKTAKVTAQSNDAFVEIVYGGTLSTGDASLTWTDVSTGNSSVEYNINADGISGGITKETFTAIAGGGQARGATKEKITSKLPLVVDINGNNSINLSIVVTPYAASSDVSGSITWDEVY